MACEDPSPFPRGNLWVQQTHLSKTSVKVSRQHIYVVSEVLRVSDIIKEVTVSCGVLVILLQ
jgi:hypothetical protein